jgi:rod shape determining protein RodA
VNSARRSVSDYWLIAFALGLSLFGIAMVYSAGQTDMPSVAAGVWRKQVIWFALSLGAGYVATRWSVRLLEWLTVPL